MAGLRLEKHIVRDIKTWLEGEGFYVIKIHGSPLQLAGLPDLLFFRNGYGYALEVKRPGNEPTQLQASMLRRLSGYLIVADWVTSVEEAACVLRTAGSAASPCSAAAGPRAGFQPDAPRSHLR